MDEVVYTSPLAHHLPSLRVCKAVQVAVERVTVASMSGVPRRENWLVLTEELLNGNVSVAENVRL